MDLSCGRKTVSLQKVYNLSKHKIFHSSTAMNLAPWIISEGVLYIFLVFFFPQKLNEYFHLLLSKFFQSMVAI